MPFAVIRHPDVAALGTCPAEALEHHRSLGWVRVSDWRDRPDAFHLADFADATDDLDAPLPDPEPETDPEPAKPATKRTKEA